MEGGESNTLYEPSSMTTSRMSKPAQPLLTLSGVGLALGYLNSALRKIRRGVSPMKFFKLPRTPKYLRNNYVKYPALFLLFLFAARRVRAAISQ